VVVGVPLALVLLLEIFVWLVVVLDPRMVVIVVVCGHQVGPFLGLSVVVDHVVMGVAVNHLVVLMSIGHDSTSSVEPLPAPASGNLNW
jgi:hypothetical protein